MSNYYRITSGLNSVGTLIPSTDNPYNHIKEDKDYYLSIYSYNEEQKKLAEEIIQKDGRDRQRGVSGIEDVKTNYLVFDIDNSSDLVKAKEDTSKVLDKLVEKGIDVKNILISFSGNKGFSLVVKHDKELNPQEHKTIALGIAKEAGVEIDSKVYNPSRIFRLNFTKHQETGLYKTPISVGWLKNYSIDFIKKQAEKKPDTINLKMNVQKLPESVFNIKKEIELKKVDATVIESTQLDFTKKPFYLTDAKYVLHKGHIPKGWGNEGMMILCSTYRNAGFDKTDAYHMLKGVNEKRSEIYNVEKKSNDDIWLQIVNTVYSAFWRGGMYSEKENELLQLVVKQHNIKEKTSLTSIDNVSERFLNFAENINQNIIKTGVTSLDDNLLITTGMMVGLLAAPSAGKCLGKGTLVRMFDGSTKKVEDIQSGEYLMGDDSTPRKVLSVCKGEEMLYKVSQLNGEDYIVNESHILSLKCVANFKKTKKQNQFQFNKVENIDIKTYLSKSATYKKYYKGYKVGVEYSHKDLKYDPYLVGYWLGNGTSSQTGFTTADKDIVDYLDGCFLPNGYHRSTYDKYDYRYATPRGQKNPFLIFLQEMKLVNNKHIPNIYLINSRKNRLSLLAGIIDSDGHYDRRKNAYEITFKSNVLAENTVELIRSLGFKATSRKKQAKYKSFTKGKLYEGVSEVNRIYMSGDNLNQIPVKLERKKATGVEKAVDILSTGISVSSLGIGEYYGFEIDGNKLFLLNDFTVTHNTSLATKMLETTLEQGQRALFLSLDMHDNLLFQRLIQRQTGVNVAGKLRKMIKTDKNFDSSYKIRTDNSILEGIKKVSDVYRNAQFNFTRGATIESIEEDIKNSKQKYGDELKLVVVDYLEKVRGPYSDPTANSGFVASRLSDLASTYDVCIILILQPQKSAGDPSEELLSMRNVKGASVIEQDCRVILTLWRPGFNPKNPSYDKFSTIAVVKNNMGELITLDYGFEGLKGQFNELTAPERAYLDSLRERIKEEKTAQKKEDW